MARSKRRGGGAKRKTYYWDGLQWPITAMDSLNGEVFELVNPTAVEFMPRTLERIRGFVGLDAGSTAKNRVAMKIMMLKLSDAGSVPLDNQAIDTFEEEIADRQLWTWSGMTQDDSSNDHISIEIDVKVKIRIPSAGRYGIFLLADPTIIDVTNITGYLRVLLRDN